MGWPRKYRTFWCVIESRGTAYLVSARVTRSKSIAAWIADADKSGKGWKWWARKGYFCKRCDIKVRSTANNSDCQ